MLAVTASAVAISCASFITPLQVEAGFFSDVSSGNPHIKGIEYFYAKNISKGYEDGTFKPDQLVTRAEALKFIYKSKDTFAKITGGQVDFADVEAGQWYVPYVAKAFKEGVVKGFGENRFGPNENVTRTQFLKMLFKVHGIDVDQYVSQAQSLEYEDIDKEAWYMPYLYFARGNSIVGETSPNTIGPNDYITRAEVADITYRLVLNVAQMRLSSAEARIATVMQQINDGKFEEIGTGTESILEILDGANEMIPENPTVRGANKFARAIDNYVKGERESNTDKKKELIARSYQYAIDATLISDNPDLIRIAVALKVMIRNRYYELMMI